MCETYIKRGTFGYVAPEVIRGERYSFIVDSFGVGCIVYMTPHGQVVFGTRAADAICE